MEDDYDDDEDDEENFQGVFMWEEVYYLVVFLQIGYFLFLL